MLTNIYTLDLSRTGKFGCMSKCINKKAHFECTFNYLLTSILLYNFFVLISHIFFFHQHKCGVVLIEVEQNPYLNAWNWLLFFVENCHAMKDFCILPSYETTLAYEFVLEKCSLYLTTKNSIQSLFVVTPKHSLDFVTATLNHVLILREFICHIIILSS